MLHGEPERGMEKSAPMKMRDAVIHKLDDGKFMVVMNYEGKKDGMYQHESKEFSFDDLGMAVKKIGEHMNGKNLAEKKEAKTKHLA